MLEIAVANTERLVKLVNEILDLERIRSGQAELHSRMCGADELLQAAARMREKEAAKAKIAVEIESITGAAEVKVWADPDRVIQAVSNLISNAIKFSPEGGRVVLKAARLSGDEALVEVRDSGKGIPEDKLEQIFEHFQQVDASDSRSIGGTGLGLAICRGIVLQHGGKIWAMNRPGDGASFFFTLPVRAKDHLG
jgi:signal transduction histidine kinase